MTHVKYVLMVLVAVVFTWLLHEFAHWLTGELLGNDMVMTLNTSYPTSGKYVADWNATVISIAGPIITLLQAFVVYFILKTKPHKFLFPFLLTCLYMRFLAGGMNFINLNDEGRVSMELGLGMFTLPLLIVGVLLYLTINTSKNKEFKSTFILATTLLIMVFSSILILTDQTLHVKIL